LIIKPLIFNSLIQGIDPELPYTLQRNVAMRLMGLHAATRQKQKKVQVLSHYGSVFLLKVLKNA
jgi:hypothetical protein